MKNPVVCCLLFLVLAIAAPAQSGRRVQYPIPGTTPSETKPAASVATDESSKTTKEPAGYSESAPNQPVSIYVARKNREKEKSKNKKQAADEAAKTEPAIKANADEDVLRVDTNLITIPVTVATRSGSFVPSLSRSNFQIFEDGAEQEIAYFGSFDKPFTAILLLDVSESTSLKIERIQDGAIAFVKQMLPQDKVMVIAFDSGVQTVIEYTNDKAALEQAIRKIKFGGGTALYDAVELSIRKKIAKIEGKKAIVLFTDGVDTASGATYADSVSEAVESEAVIFPIYLNTFLDNVGLGGGGGVMSTPPILGMPGQTGVQVMGPTKADYEIGRRYLQDLAAATGGRIYRSDTSASGLSSAFIGIAEELRSQYEIGYYPAVEGRPGDRKKIRVRINRPNLIINARDSYIVKK